MGPQLRRRTGARVILNLTAYRRTSMRMGISSRCRKDLRDRNVAMTPLTWIA